MKKLTNKEIDEYTQIINIIDPDKVQCVMCNKWYNVDRTKYITNICNECNVYTDLKPPELINQQEFKILVNELRLYGETN